MGGFPIIRTREETVKEHNFPYAQKRLNACPNVNESEAEQEIGPAQQNWIAAVQLFSPKLYAKKLKLLEKQAYQHREKMLLCI